MTQETKLILDALAAEPTPNIPGQFVDDEIRFEEHRLYTMLQTKMADNPDAWAMVQRFREDPAVWSGILRDALHQTGAATDPDIIDAARELLNSIEPLDPDQLADNRLSDEVAADLIMGRAPDFDGEIQAD